MKKKLLFFLLVLCGFTVYSQNVTVGPSAKPLMASINKDKTEGSPYFNDDYEECKIKTISKKEFVVKALRYNLQTQQLEYRDDNLNVYSIQDSVESFSLVDSKKSTYSFVRISAEKSAGFAEVLFKGKKNLLKQYNVKREMNEDFYTKKKTAKIVRQPVYYASNGNEMQKIALTAKGIAAVLNNKKDQITNFIQKEEPDIKSDLGLINIFKYYNSLD